MEIKVVSKEMIKPSFQTQEHLRSYQLSFLDQMAPEFYSPYLLFYSSKGTEFEFNSAMLSLKLKKSLSEVLTLFYPLAGRVKGNLLIDCNDEGVPFLNAQVNCQLSDVIRTTNPNVLDRFVPFQTDSLTDVALGVQVNHFVCGGVAIGCSITHKITDAVSFIMFLKSWAAKTAQKESETPPQFVSASLFPPKDTSVFDPPAAMIRVIAKRFVFKDSVIESIRAKYSSKNQRRPSRVEALSAFIWSRFVSLRKQVPGRRVYPVIHLVNLRTRIDPPLPENAFGNLYHIAMTIPCLDGDDEESFNRHVKQMREEISRVDKEYVKELQKATGHSSFLKESRAQELSMSELAPLSFTSLCSFRVYDCDFSWGKPEWFIVLPLPVKNLVMFINTKSDDGIEAYINLEEADMAKFQKDAELLALVSAPEVEVKKRSRM